MWLLFIFNDAICYHSLEFLSRGAAILGQAHFFTSREAAGQVEVFRWCCSSCSWQDIWLRKETSVFLACLNGIQQYFTLGTFNKYVRMKIGLFDPPLPPCTQNDVIVTT